ncbi:MAG TPA: gamma-glutamyl-gamma-aminobutyrate hydrolase family protein [Bacillota bacterium]|nr:gamma-glutamyl-gamma-aminobutyrate hydrolase family protein [Bacillota bacterium]
MKPLIGITPSMEIDEANYMTTNDNVRAVVESGGLPVIVPYLLKETDIEEITVTIDGLYATGGYDIDPTLFGEEPHPHLGTIIPARDTFEIMLVKKMLEKNKPILAVCRGSQILNLAAGGDMYQDIYAQTDRELLQHQQKAPQDHASHFVHVREDSLLKRLVQMDKLRVNSRHHQANRTVQKPLQISGKASDMIIEAVESMAHTFVLGVQWHPENMFVSGDKVSQRIFQGFINACRTTKAKGVGLN